MKQNEVLIVVPMKDPKEAKTRLESCLEPSHRAELATHLFMKTLACLNAAQDLEDFDLAVISRSKKIRFITRGNNLEFIWERALGLNLAVEQARQWAAYRGYRYMCVIPGDLAMPDACDIATLLRQTRKPRQLTLCPSVELGTNGLGLPLDCDMSFAYGVGSLNAHIKKGLEARLMPVVLPLKSLQRDIDVAEDLQALPEETTSRLTGGNMHDAINHAYSAS
ncbi:MAG: 2-phospho-L-lactate guanylyltransferase [Pseudomonadota bacterium]